MQQLLQLRIFQTHTFTCKVEMPDYSKGVIYSIRSSCTDEEYIGSTCQPIATRLAKHKSDFKRWLRGSADFRASYHIVKHPDAYIQVIEDFPCKCVEELTAREYEIIKTRKVVNKLGNTNFKPAVPEPTMLDLIFKPIKQPLQQDDQQPPPPVKQTDPLETVNFII